MAQQYDVFISFMDTSAIKTEAEYRQALERARLLWDAQPGTPEAAELEILLPLIEDHEDRNYPIDPPDPVEAIKIRMEDLGLSMLDLAAWIGTTRDVSDILDRRETLTPAMIRALSEKLGLPEDVLEVPYSLEVPTEDPAREAAL